MHSMPRGRTAARAFPLLLALAGCGGDDGGGTGPDNEDPTVTITAPAAGASVSGDVTVTATAADNQSVAGVQFELDGEALGAEDTDPPYETIWHAGDAEAGTHTLRATARDPSGNVGSTDPIEVTIAAASTGAIEVTAATTGAGSDPDGYTVSVDGASRGSLDANGTLTIDGLTFGAHTVRLGGISSFCTAAGEQLQVTVGAEPAEASFALTCEAAPGGRITFEAVPSSSAPHEIRTILADGSFETTVTTGLEPEFEPGLEGEQPTWSPDGSQIALIRPGVNTATLFRVNADGSELTELATLPAFANELDWGPGGTLVFCALRPVDGGEPIFDLYFIEADGSNLRTVFSDPGDRQSPAWSPDGTRLAFAAVLPDGDHTELSVVNSDGTSVESLTTGFKDVSPAWSPDGTMLAFRRDDAAAGTTKVWLVGTDGSEPHALSNYSGSQFSPTWSPDGAWVAFTSENASGQPLLIARTDGSDVRQVPGTFQYSGQPDWGPDAE